jgi:hypothetical protein
MMTEGGEAIVKESLGNVCQKYYAEGRVLICAEASPKYESAVVRQLSSPGMMTLVPNLDLEKFVAALANEGIPPEDAEAIAQSVKIIEDGAYFVPKEYDL